MLIESYLFVTDRAATN